MAQVKLLKIVSGNPEEFASASDDITLASFTAGAGPVMSATGIEFNGGVITELGNLSFNAPSVNVINFTAGNGIVDDIMLKERNNIMTSAGAILFGVVTDTAGQLDSLKIPHIAGVPTATPAYSSDAGYLAYDSVGKSLYAWDGVAWDNLNTVSSAESISNVFTAGENLTIRDAVYISAADTVSISEADGTDTAAQVIGFAEATVLAAASVAVKSDGVMTGFTGLTAGAQYFLSATGGAITASAPTGSGNKVVQVGFAKSTTALFIKIDYRVKRAA